MAGHLSLGMIVSFQGAPGLGRVGDLDDSRVRVDFFESAAKPVVGSQWLPLADVRRVALGEQTRVFFKDAKDRWRAGRVVGGDPGAYFVRIPNVQLDVDIPETRLFVRWEKAPKDPLQVLSCRTPTRRPLPRCPRPVGRSVIAEKSTGSATGIVSSSVHMHAHQINAALRIIRDPIQRYLLADEVGIGKTIQASNWWMRQILHDAPGRRIGVTCP